MDPIPEFRLRFEQVEDFAFSKLRERYKKWTGNSFDEKDLISFWLANEQGYLTNAGALAADESSIRWSRLFCTRWNGLNKRGGTIDAFDDAEYSGILEKGLFHNPEERQYFSLEQFNPDLWEKLDGLNHENFKHKEHSRCYYWEEEKAELMPLPSVPYSVDHGIGHSEPCS